MINICEGRGYSDEEEHDCKVIHEDNSCPLCNALKLIKHLNETIADLNRENDRMDNQLAMCQDACEVCPSRFECVTNKGSK